jgi:predicted NUDIX family NTP pyrophosphohydrolase
LDCLIVGVGPAGLTSAVYFARYAAMSLSSIPARAEPPSGPLEPLGDIRQRGGKRVTAFAVEGDLDFDAIKSNRFEIEWPPKGGSMQSFPEIDRAAWFDLPAAHVKILESQRALLDRLVDRAAVSAP